MDLLFEGIHIHIVGVDNFQACSQHRGVGLLFGFQGLDGPIHHQVVQVLELLMAFRKLWYLALVWHG